MRKCLLGALLLLGYLSFFPARASHIVGGEFELRHVEGNRYTLNLIQYFDEIYGNDEAEDQSTVVYIYRKSDDTFVRSVELINTRSTFVPYTNPECTIDELQTRRILYTNTITLPDEEFDDPAGYYVVYERCCRNYNVNNLAFDGTGQTFYLEFPAVVKDGQPLINSTPILFPPLSDYACVNENFYFDFAGTDVDGDSLVYSLVAPFNSSETDPIPENSNPLPTPKPRPHQEVTFVNGIDVNNMIPGSPPLRIDQRGFLTVRPSTQGLFVFGVRAEEYRNGEKIGEVRRDFQMLVIDCDSGSPPEIVGQVKGERELYQEGQVLTFGVDDEKCLNVSITDPDILAEGREEVTIRAIGVNFSQDIQELVPLTSTVLEGANDTLTFDFCLPECPYTEDGSPMIIDLVAYDDACSVPLTDTLRITVEVVGPENEDPFIVDNPVTLDVEVEAGQPYELPIQGRDNDGDLLLLTAEGVGFDLADYGMELREVRLVPGEVQKTFLWNTDCATFPFDVRDEFEVVVRLSDDSDCSFGEPDELRLLLTVNLPPNEGPVIRFDGLTDTTVDVMIGETLSFDVIAEEADGDLMTLTGVGDGFELAEVGINFPGNSGVQRILSPFAWDLSCNSVDLNAQSTYAINFIAQDQNLCNAPSGDTVTVTINVLPPANQAPEVVLRGVSSDTIAGTIDQPIVFDVVGTDQDVDIITLRLAEVSLDGNPLEATVNPFGFSPAQGRGQVSSRFYWVPDCSLLSKDFTNAQFALTFVVEDDQCFSNKSDTVQAYLDITAAPLRLEDFEPHNAFTPNQDGWGDFFFLNFCDDPQGGCDLPLGDCANAFERIEIYNRWGKLVYQTDQPEFQWYAEGMGGGAYYFLAFYARQTYKGRIYVHRPELDNGR